MSDDEFDDIPDDFADVQGVDWARLLAGPSSSTASTSHVPTGNDVDNIPGNGSSLDVNAVPPAAPVTATDTDPNRTTGSSFYFSEDDVMDSDFLAELDQVEQQAIIRTSQRPPSSPFTSRLGPNANAHGGRESVHGDVSSSSRFQNAGGDLTPPPQIYSAISERDRRNTHNQFDTDRSSTSAPKWRGAEPRSISGSTVHRPSVDASGTGSKKRPRSVSPMSPRRKGKMKVDDNELGRILESYEDELTCPICCDLLQVPSQVYLYLRMHGELTGAQSVASHVGNPCGHTVCGECGWQWHVKNKNKACPCCRGKLNKKMPMIPNITMDNVVEKHVRALALNGSPGWEVGGQKYVEWMARKQAWKDNEAQRSRTATRPPQPRKPTIGLVEIINFYDHTLDGQEFERTFTDSDDELIPRPVVTRLRRAEPRA